jgi:site-specific DNA recombinase
VIDPKANWWAYGRVSGAEQKRKKTADSQIYDIKRLLPDLPPERIFVDEGESGSIPFLERPASAGLYAKLTEEARAGREPRLMVQFIDRVGRDAIDTQTIHRKLWEMVGIKQLFAVYEGDFDNSAEGKWRVNIYAGMAEYIRNRILAGAVAGLNRKSDAGDFCGGPRPFGYRAEREEADDQGKMHERGPTLPDTRRIPGTKYTPVMIVNLIKEKAVAGQSLLKIAEWLQDEGIPVSKKNRRGVWRPKNVWRIINNPIYKGMARRNARSWGKDEKGRRTLRNNPPEKIVLVYRPELQIVPTKLHDDAVEAVKAARIIRANPGHAAIEYLLRGRMVCGLCGCKYVGCTTHYRCGGRENNKALFGKHHTPCTGPAVPRAEADAAIWSQLERYCYNPGELLLELDAQMPPAHHKPTVAKAIEQLEERRKDVAGQREMVLRRASDGVYRTEAEFRREEAHLRRKDSEIAAKLADLQEQASDANAHLRERERTLSAIERYREKISRPLSFAEKRDLVYDMVVGMTVELRADGRAHIRVCYCGEPDATRRVRLWEAAAQRDRSATETANAMLRGRTLLFEPCC